MIKELLVNKAYAQVTLSSEEVIPTAFENLDIGNLFIMVVNLLIIVGLGLVLVFLALGFIKFITSQGDKVATEQAQKWITYAVIGGIGLFAVFAIKQMILTLIGANDPLAGNS
jgi:hypothetical protein